MGVRIQDLDIGTLSDTDSLVVDRSSGTARAALATVRDAILAPRLREVLWQWNGADIAQFGPGVQIGGAPTSGSVTLSAEPASSSSPLPRLRITAASYQTTAPRMAAWPILAELPRRYIVEYRILTSSSTSGRRFGLIHHATPDLSYGILLQRESAASNRFARPIQAGVVGAEVALTSRTYAARMRIRTAWVGSAPSSAGPGAWETHEETSPGSASPSNPQTSDDYEKVFSDAASWAGQECTTLALACWNTNSALSGTLLEIDSLRILRHPMDM